MIGSENAEVGDLVGGVRQPGGACFFESGVEHVAVAGFYHARTDGQAQCEGTRVGDTIITKLDAGCVDFGGVLAVADGDGKLHALVTVLLQILCKNQEVVDFPNEMWCTQKELNLQPSDP